MGKQFFRFFLIAASSLLFAEEEPSENYSLWDFHPLHVGGQTIQTARADVDAPQGGSLYFGKNNAYATMLVPIDKSNYFFPRVEWNQFTLDWNKNPKFDQIHFSYAQFGLMFYSKGLDQWRWILRGDYNLDLKHFSKPSLYGLFSWLVWGAYNINDQWRYHVGGTGYVGMKGEMTYPLIGLDYSPTKQWTFEAIFPITYSVQYHLNENWRFSIKGRPLKERFRTGKEEPQPRSIFSYSTVGTEINIHYEIPMRLEFEIYGGYNCGGDFYIKDKNGHNALYTEVKAAPYLGALIDYGF